MSSWLQLDALTKSYGDVRAVHDLSLEVGPGEVVALLGPNGAGKSTTIDMMLGLIRPDSGTVSLFGGSPRQACLDGRVGAMLQSGGLLQDVTVRELLELLRHLYPQALPLDELVERAGIGDILTRKSTRLSGGQTQRVRFACALVPDPDLLVLDEPTAAMDVETRHAFWASMHEWTAQGRTLLFATHYLQEADQVADRVVVLRAGTVVADGSAVEVKALSGGRTITVVVPGATGLADLPGVLKAEALGDRWTLVCRDSDSALRALLTAFPRARDVEVTVAGLEHAFRSLTATPEESVA
jgi:ABC-2 type transport system ATP-binding protein